jgi:2-phospho-L-lactate guanylyltransferase
MIIWAIVPVNALRDSKSRLSSILTAEQRAELTGRLLGRTLDILGQVEAIGRRLVVSRDPVALKIARKHGASTFVETNKQDLNMALTRAALVAEQQRANCVLVLPTDLPFVEAADLQAMIDALPAELDKGDGGNEFLFRAMAICGDQTGMGTNALMVCPPTALSFRYGANSFNAHLRQAADLNMARKIVRAPGIAFDLVTEEDWRVYQEAIRESRQAA